MLKPLYLRTLYWVEKSGEINCLGSVVLQIFLDVLKRNPGINTRPYLLSKNTTNI